MKLKYEAMVWCKNIITQRTAKKLQGNLKFIYSEKATKFCEISTNYLTGST